MAVLHMTYIFTILRIYHLVVVSCNFWIISISRCQYHMCQMDLSGTEGGFRGDYWRGGMLSQVKPQTVMQMWQGLCSSSEESWKSPTLNRDSQILHSPHAQSLVGALLERMWSQLKSSVGFRRGWSWGLWASLKVIWAAHFCDHCRHSF